MPLVTFKDLCIDANDIPAMQGFWAGALGLEGEFFADDGSAVLRGSQKSQTVWLNPVPEAREVKNRVHLDLMAPSLDYFAGCRQISTTGEFAWTVFADPEDNEFCVFLRPDRTAGLKDVVVDSVDHEQIGAWWADVWGGTLGHGEGYTYLDDIPGAPVESFDFVPVPEPKTVKNRLHWDVTLAPGVAVDDLVAVGATVLAEPNDDARWTVMADPEGNEFCVFERR
ncbi:VOC family protein [Aeromicrobium sp. P5_D10]